MKDLEGYLLEIQEMFHFVFWNAFKREREKSREYTMSV